MSALLRIRGLGLAFAGVRALDDVSLDVAEGEILAIIGPNGAGKTSLFNCISGLYRADVGAIELGGRNITRRAPDAIAGLGVARMFQNLALFENLSVLDNLLLGRHHLRARGFLESLLFTRRVRAQEIADRTQVEDIIDFLDLEAHRATPVQILSYGVRKRVELGRALAMEPRLLLLDEPTAGLNQEETEDMARYILDIQEELGITQILIEHELRFVLDLASRVAVLDFGQKIAEGAPHEVRADPRVIEAYIGHAGAARVAGDGADGRAGEAGDGAPRVVEAGDGAPRVVEDRAPVDVWAGVAEPVAVERLGQTLPGRLVLGARRWGEGIALRVKELGIWREISWNEYAATVRAVARVLLELGVAPGDHVAIISDNRPEWLFADLGAQSIGARSVGVYQTNPPGDLAYILNDSGAVVLFCEDQEQVDKAVAVADETPSVRHVVVFDPRGTRSIDDSRLISWQELLERGRALVAEERPPGDAPQGGGVTDDGDWFVGRIASLDPMAPVMVIYTSGTTGAPKGALISSANVIATMLEINRLLGVDERDAVLSYLPLCHVAEKIFSLFQPLTAGSVVHFGESIDTVQRDLREVSPTVFLGVPRIWEKMSARVRVKMADASWIARSLFGYFSRKGQEIARRRAQGALTLWDRVLWRLGDLLVYRPLQERLGMRRCRVPVSGAAPISPELLFWFHGLGIPILEGYGQTECTGVSHLDLPGAMRVGTVGEVVPTTECRLGEDDEVLVRGSHVFCGYLNRPEDTTATIDRDGWLHTGDLGAIDEDGCLRIIGRKKEIIITSGGKNLSPEKIENALKTSPFIKEVVAVGDGRNFISALVQVEYESTSAWATREHIPFTSYTDLVSQEPVVQLLGREIDKANENLARVEAVRAFRLLPRELDQDEGELTATQKVRRGPIHARYAELIESMYQRRPRAADPAASPAPAASAHATDIGAEEGS